LNHLLSMIDASGCYCNGMQTKDRIYFYDQRRVNIHILSIYKGCSTVCLHPHTNTPTYSTECYKLVSYVNTIYSKKKRREKNPVLAEGNFARCRAAQGKRKVKSGKKK
jgi:hypothetical protein